MDDLEFYAQTRAEAEDVLHSWDALLSSYELSLNIAKTQIIDGPTSPEFPWRVQLAQFQLRDVSDAALTNDLYSLFTLAFELSRQNPQDSVLSYAIGRVKPIPVHPSSWKAFVRLMLAAVTREPSSLRYVSAALTNGRSLGLPIERDLVEETMNNLCHFHDPLEHGSEVAWSLATIRGLGLKLRSEAAARIACMQDNCSLLLLFDLLGARRVRGSPPDMTGAVIRAEDPFAWRSEDWLLAYECGRNGWSSDANLVSHEHWKELRDLGVRFYSEMTIPAAFKSVVGGGPATALPSAEVPILTPARSESGMDADSDEVQQQEEQSLLDEEEELDEDEDEELKEDEVEDEDEEDEEDFYE